MKVLERYYSNIVNAINTSMKKIESLMPRTIGKTSLSKKDLLKNNQIVNIFNRRNQAKHDFCIINNK